jgi:hypothetical protein
MAGDSILSAAAVLSAADVFGRCWVEQATHQGVVNRRLALQISGKKTKGAPLSDSD